MGLGAYGTAPSDGGLERRDVVAERREQLDGPRRVVPGLAPVHGRTLPSPVGGVEQLAVRQHVVDAREHHARHGDDRPLVAPAGLDPLVLPGEVVVRPAPGGRRERALHEERLEVGAGPHHVARLGLAGAAVAPGAEAGPRAQVLGVGELRHVAPYLREQGLGGVLDGAIDFRHLAGSFAFHVGLLSDDLREVAYDGHADDLLGLVAVADARVEHVAHDDDGHGQEQARHGGHRPIQEATRAGWLGGDVGVVDDVDRLDLHDLRRHVGDHAHDGVGDLRRHLRVLAGHGQRDDARGRRAGYVELVVLEVVEAKLRRHVALHAVGLHDGGHVAGEHLAHAHVLLGERRGLLAAAAREDVHGGGRGVLVGQELRPAKDEDAGQDRQRDHERHVLAQQAK